LLSLLFDPEDGDNKFLRNVGELIQDYTASHHKRFIIVAAVKISTTIINLLYVSNTCLMELPALIY
jgi:hypothetical protein